MSALLLKAEMDRRDGECPVSAKSGLTHRSKKAPLFGHLVGIRGTGVMECRCFPAQSALTPTNLITLAHFSVSSAMNWPKSTGEPASAMPPTSATGQIVTSARLSAFGGKADIGHIDQAAMSRGLGERVVSANCITIGETLTIMEYSLLKFFHILGAVIIGGGLIGVWMADLRSRQLRELKSF